MAYKLKRRSAKVPFRLFFSNPDAAVDEPNGYSSAVKKVLNTYDLHPHSELYYEMWALRENSNTEVLANDKGKTTPWGSIVFYRDTETGGLAENFDSTTEWIKLQYQQP